MANRNPSPQGPLAKWGQTGRSLVFIALGAGIATASTGALQALPLRSALQQNAVSQAATPYAQNSGAIAPAPANFVASIVQEVGPAVVRIDASRTVTTQIPQAFRNPAFRQFFGDLPESSERVEQGLGSGFIVEADGRIITNAHVVDGADTVQVTLKDGRMFEGKVVGSDPVTDVAVVQIEATNLPTVDLSDSDELQAGEWAIAIGNPLGLDNTVTVGIVSATGRSSGQVGVSDKRVDFIQTDAAINPGNSGGPLLNQDGEVIGMNTAIIQGAQGLGFAIPINSVDRIADQLVATGRVDHPYLGIRMVVLTPQNQDAISQQLGLDLEETEGVLVVEVVPGSPAAQAGFQPGDVVQSVGGTAVTDAQSVQRQVERSTIGETLPVQVRRNGSTETLQVRPEALPQ
ncbi:MAG: trypsin-like peptidase domain-containing protein [Cyanobacteria bacterium]|nr:trypsin-like peptidase domain-containing protein [Cyanobacteriota bacterium]